MTALDTERESIDQHGRLTGELGEGECGIGRKETLADRGGTRDGGDIFFPPVLAVVTRCSNSSFSLMK